MDNSWKPNPHSPQLRALQTKAFELLMGGARGGSKTETGIVWMMKPIKNPKYRGLVIRKNADDLSDWADRARRMYSAYGVKVGYKPPIFEFPSGAKIKTGHLRDENAYTKYQGHEYQRMLIEELTQIPDEKRYMQLLGSCRSTVEGLDARCFGTTNPGGAGHAWVKERFIDPAPPNTLFFDNISGRSRVFIPSRVEDTPQLMEKDPNYVKYLDSLKATDFELYKAWRLGDWDTFAGQFYREWKRDTHVMKSFTPNYERADRVFIGGLDWGRADPFAFTPTMIMPVEYEGVRFHRAITYNEVYGTDKSPKEWGEIILNTYKFPLDKFRFIQCDTQIYNKGNDNSMSIYEQFCQYNPIFRGLLKPASKERIGGWENMHNWLSIAPDGLPYWLVTENCVNLIKSIPLLIHDETLVEDVAESTWDHAPDAIRYMFKALKWIDGRVGGVKHKERHIPTVTTQKSDTGYMDSDDWATNKNYDRNWQTI